MFLSHHCTVINYPVAAPAKTPSPRPTPRRLHLKPSSSYSHGSTLEIESEGIPKAIGSMGLVRIFTYT